jgi:septum formation protein
LGIPITGSERPAVVLAQSAPEPHIYLASASPRRRILLAQIGVRHRRLSVRIDETPAPRERPAGFALRMALAKARAGQQSLNAGDRRLVLGADTVVVVDEQIFGKPDSREHALSMLRQLSGRVHEVLSAVALVYGTREATRVQRSRVEFRPLDAAECQRYWDSGEPLDKAGGYAIQGYGATFVRRLEGSYSGVMGLPLYETWELLAELGFAIDPPPPPRARTPAGDGQS